MDWMKKVGRKQVGRKLGARFVMLLISTNIYSNVTSMHRTPVRHSKYTYIYINIYCIEIHTYLYIANTGRNFLQKTIRNNSFKLFIDVLEN